MSNNYPTELFDIARVQHCPLSKLDEYIVKIELPLKDVKPKCERRIIWNQEIPQKTTFSILYVHGFCASPREISPVIENVSAELSCNAYFTRLQNHGRESSPEVLSEISIAQMQKEFRHDFEVARKIGENIIIIGSSFGAALSSWFTSNSSEDVYALILLSPLFGLKAFGSGFVRLPIFGKVICNLILGKYFSFHPQSDDEAYFWTVTYRSDAINIITKFAHYVYKKRMRFIRVPTLVLYTPNDETIHIGKVKTGFSKIPASLKQRIEIKEAKRHVLAGDILSPETNTYVHNYIISFLRDPFLVP